MKYELQIIAFVFTFALMAADWRVRRLIGAYSYFVRFAVSIYIIFSKLVIIKKIFEFLVKRADIYKFGYAFKVCLIILKFKIFTEVLDNMKGVRFDKPHDYVCKGDRDLPREQQTVFRVQYLNAKEQAELRDMLYGVSGMGETRSEKFLTGTVALKALKFGLKGWDNFNYDDTGEPIPFNEENFSCIPPKERDEIATHIRGTEGEA